MTPVVKTILIEEPVYYHPMTRACIEAQTKAQGFAPEIRMIPEKDRESIKNSIEKLAALSPSEKVDEYDTAKKILVFQNARGHQFKTCPGTSGGICCNYYVFNFQSGCPLNCSYCYLSSYLNQPSLTIQPNLESPLGELMGLFRSQPKQFFRVGTGELADSLALPASDPINRSLIEAFSQEPNTLLEFKTKSDRISPLLDLDPKGKVMISWSMAPPAISLAEEHETATPIRRLLVAKKVIQGGYKVAFHLDPLIFMHDSFEDWQKDHTELLEMIFSEIPPHQISWISLGGLRFLKGLREKIIQRFPQSKIPYQEMVPGADGKMRYPKPIRKKMFSFISQEVQRLAPTKAPPVYLCMEAREVWHNSLGGTPDPQGNLRPLFTHAFSSSSPRAIELT